MLEKAPGKTCVIGAGYVALECAGFIAGLKGSAGGVKVLVRSILLRGFDRDPVNFIQDYMQHHGTKIEIGVVPKSIEKLSSSKLFVTYGNYNSPFNDITEEFDTVLCAIGREADLNLLGLDTLSDSALIAVNGKTGKLICQNEQTSVSHVYAVGDVVDKAPELTPTAIMAGKLLARRLFGGKTKSMVYTDVATTVGFILYMLCFLLY
jgi:thioredoxin reductase (NADPH)